MKEITTKEKILRAARSLFAAQGFAGTSIGQIAKKAMVNHSLIFHHFHNKAQLWAMVKQQLVEEASSNTQTLPSSTLPFSSFLKELFIQNMRFYRNNLDIIRMINWQRLEHNANHPIGVSKSNEMKKWITTFKIYQKKGDIASSIKPEFIITMILSIISSAALDPNIFISGMNEDKYIKFCIAHIRKAVKPD